MRVFATPSGDARKKLIQRLVKLKNQLKFNLSKDLRLLLIRKINAKLSSLGTSRKWIITDTVLTDPTLLSGAASSSAQLPENVPKNTAKKHKVVKQQSTAVKKTAKRPQTSVDCMVLRAIVHLDEPGGSTMKNIQEYVHAHYDLKCQALTNVFIQIYLKTASEGDTPILLKNIFSKRNQKLKTGIRNLAITISNLTGANNIIAAAAGVPAAPMSVPQPATIAANRP